MINEIDFCELSFSEIDSVGGGAAAGCQLEIVMLCGADGQCAPTEMVVCRPD